MAARKKPTKRRAAKKKASRRTTAKTSGRKKVRGKKKTAGRKKAKAKRTTKKATVKKKAKKKTARTAAKKKSRKKTKKKVRRQGRGPVSTIPKRLENRRRKSENEGDLLLAERLRLARAKRGVTRKVVAEQTGIPYESLTGYELCEQRAPFSRIRLLAMHLRVSLDYLAGRTGQMSRRG